jgi:hypothetical protein
MDAVIVYESDRDGQQLVAVGVHRIQFGGRDGDGFCYACQSFDCLDNLTDEEREAVSRA